MQHPEMQPVILLGTEKVKHQYRKAIKFFGPVFMSDGLKYRENVF